MDKLNTRYVRSVLRRSLSDPVFSFHWYAMKGSLCCSSEVRLWQEYLFRFLPDICHILLVCFYMNILQAFYIKLMNILYLFR
jgi:hypothetical protein